MEGVSENEAITVLHHFLKNKHTLEAEAQMLLSEESDEDEDTVYSDESEKIITQSVGSVNQIRNIFQGESEMSDKANRGANKCDGAATSVQSSGTITASPSEVRTKSMEDNKTNMSLNHDGSVSDNHEEHQSDQRKLRSEKKRKLTDSCEKKKTVAEVNEDESDIKGNLYPVFVKKHVDAKDNGDGKDKREQRKTRRAKKSRQDKGEQEQKGEDSDEKAEGETSLAAKIGKENLQVIDVRTVVSLIEKLERKMNEKSTEQQVKLDKMLSEMGQTMESNLSKVKVETQTDVQAAMEMYQKDLNELQENMKEQKRKTAIMAELMKLNQQVVVDLASRISEIELKLARKSITLTGLDFSNKKDERNLQIESFLDEVLKCQVLIEDSYFLGDPKAMSRPVVVVFNSIRDKNDVYQRKSELKNYEGVGGRGIFINNYLPGEISESKRKEREMLKELKSAKIKYEYTENGLKVGPNLYRKKIEAPDPTKILDLTSKELERILELPVVKTTPEQIQDNFFIAYSADTENYNQIRDTYLKIRLLHARARHIVCAYYLPGEEIHYTRDFIDDGDMGAGRPILNYMVENEIINKAIFVVRFTGKNKMHSERLKTYAKMAQKVMEMNPYNATLRRNQNYRHEQII